MAAGKHKTEGTLATLFLLNISAFIILFAWFKTKLQELYKKKKTKTKIQQHIFNQILKSLKFYYLYKHPISFSNF
jgi:hypothetical protein